MYPSLSRDLELGGDWGRRLSRPVPWQGIRMDSFWSHSGTDGSEAAQGSFHLSSHSDKERKLCAHPRLEIYQQDQIYFMCPLARQGDFYVPEVKETERRSRGPVEASDTQVDSTGMEGWGMRVGIWLSFTVGIQASSADMEGTHLPIGRVACF